MLGSFIVLGRSVCAVGSVDGSAVRDKWVPVSTAWRMEGGCKCIE